MSSNPGYRLKEEFAMAESKSNIIVDGIKNVGEVAKLFEVYDPIVYPKNIYRLTVENTDNSTAVKSALAGNRLLAIFYQVPSPDETAGFPISLALPTFEFRRKIRSSVGVLVRIVKSISGPSGVEKIIIRSICRISCSSIRGEADGSVSVVFDRVSDNANAKSAENKLNADAKRSALEHTVLDLMAIEPVFGPTAHLDSLHEKFSCDNSEFADAVAGSLRLSHAEAMLILTQTSVDMRLDLLLKFANRELEIENLGAKIRNEVRESMNRPQREYFLHEQLRAIQKELSEETQNPDLVELHKRFNDATLPLDVSNTIKREFERLELLPTNSPEYYISYSYVDWLLNLPWLINTEDQLDILQAAKILDQDHFGLKDVKQRILEYLAVLQLKKDEDNRRSPILCLAGPPGVGKTSLGRSIARALGRKFVRVSLGGVRDEAELRGHRRTYIGAMPGRIIKALKRAGSNNPVFMLDEIDKLVNDGRGNPAAALLEILDPEQNSAFSDNYIELDYDLSQVFFIATANMMDRIPPALKDRMEVITLPGYTMLEKRQIAKQYLVPRQLKENGLDGKGISIPLPVIDTVIQYYTVEAGVRELERKIGTLCRRMARKILEETVDAKDLKLSPKCAQKLLGARVLHTDNPINGIAGCAMGLAWTAVGGVVLPIEAKVIPSGKGEMLLTGSMGNVMKESSSIAFSLVKTYSESLKLKKDFFKSNDFHIHIPDGATPKDGPSAGVTLFSAMISLLRNKPLRENLAMTGEITLTGRVTAIGGLREKLVAALRAKVSRVIIPEENNEEFFELPDEIKLHLKPCFATTVDDVLKFAFGE